MTQEHSHSTYHKEYSLASYVRKRSMSITMNAESTNGPVRKTKCKVIATLSTAAADAVIAPAAIASMPSALNVHY